MSSTPRRPPTLTDTKPNSGSLTFVFILPPALLWIIPISTSNLNWSQSESLLIVNFLDVLHQFSTDGLVRRFQFNPRLTSEHDTRRQHWKRFPEEVERRTAGRGSNQLQPFLSSQSVCSGFVSPAFKAVQWTEQRLTHTNLSGVLWPLSGRCEGGGEVAADASPLLAEWLLGTGPCSARAAASKTRRRTSPDTWHIKIYGEPKRRFVKFEDIVRQYSNME